MTIIGNLNILILILFLLLNFLKLILTNQFERNILAKIIKSWITSLIYLLLVILYLVLKFVELRNNITNLNPLYEYVNIFLLILVILTVGFIYAINTLKKLLINFKIHSILAEIEVNRINGLFDSINHICINIAILILISIEYINHSITNNNILLVFFITFLFIFIIDVYKINYKKLGSISHKSILILNLVIYINYILFIIIYEKYTSILQMPFVLHSALLLSYFVNWDKIFRLYPQKSKNENTTQLPIFTISKNFNVNKNNIYHNFNNSNYNNTQKALQNSKISLSTLKDISDNANQDKRLKINRIKIR